MKRSFVQRDGTLLALVDFGGTGEPVLLLHGLAGYAEEWAQSAALLSRRHHVFALDLRAHGHSERRPGDVTRAAFTEDCVAAIARISTKPVILVGQSMGSVIALLTAVHHPELVSRLVMIEGTPSAPGWPRDKIAEHFLTALSAWPTPFESEAAAHEYFSGRGFNADVWTAGLERRDDGLWPRWDAQTLAETMAELTSSDMWQEWEALSVPTLIVVGEHGTVPPEIASEMAARQPTATLVTIPGAGHDVHLDAPAGWVQELEEVGD